MVESVRIGTVIAHDRRAAARWASQSRPRGQRGRGLTGQALEEAIGNVASLFPDNVIHQVAAA